MKTYESLLRALNQDLECLEMEAMDILAKSEKGIKMVSLAIEELRCRVIDKGFTDKEEEKDFFKCIKPQVLSKLIYYMKLFSIESKRPRSGNDSQKRYLMEHIDKLQGYFNNNLEFYHYYRRGDTLLDDHYFLRGKTVVGMHTDTFYSLTDGQFSTSHDSSVATIMAHEMLIEYFKKEIDKLGNNHGNDINSPNKKKYRKLFWTGNKVDLIELIYALYASGSINRGVADIKEIATSFERLLEMDLGDYYHTYLEIRSRKIRRTKFIDRLKDSLDQHMQDLDS
ncbi:RteC domain-containing protein [Yeosuana marina]|uniref:RteC domain-containing protein n=1 Tax=Yeosuana marina TaxID=1565536 RepID=UPI0030C8CF89